MRTLMMILLLASQTARAQPPLDPDVVDPDGSRAPDTVDPIPAWSPSGSQFEERLASIADHIKKNNPTNDPRVYNLIVTVTARTGGRSWLKRRVWDDGKVRFAVAREAEVIVPLTAIRAAEQRARALLGQEPGKDSRRLLDWYIDDNGVAHALVGRWRSLAERGESSP